MSSQQLDRCSSLSLRMQLREQCMPTHQAVEQLVESAGYFDSPDSYQAWLAVMQQIHARYAADADSGALQLNVSPASEVLLDALAKDSGRLLDRAQRPALPESHAVGVAYVLEGSAMGARIVRRRVERFSPVSTHYLDLLITSGARRWPMITQALGEMTLEQSGATDPRVAGALTMFEELGAAFTNGLEDLRL